MRIAVSASGMDLAAQASPVFGRCPAFVFVDTDTMTFESADNPALGAAGGAGVQAAQFVVGRGAQAVVTGNVGPNAFDVFRSAGVPVHLFDGGTVREAAEALLAGNLPSSDGASVQEHAGVKTTNPAAASSREDEVAALRKRAGELRRELAGLMERVERLEEGE